MKMLSRAQIVLAGGLGDYPEGGGHWSVFVQYLMGLTAMGHDVYWLDLFRSSGDVANDQRKIQSLCRLLQYYGFKDRFGILLFDKNIPEPKWSSAYGLAERRGKEIIQSADLLWNFCCGLRQPVLSWFKRRVLIDLDPGILQVSALEWNMDIQDHHVLLTVGSKMHDPDCEVPSLGLIWHKFTPFVHLPLWEVAADPGKQAPFSSVTEWTWHTLGLQGRLLSNNKRAAYLQYLDLPQRAKRPFELAANIHPQDATGDRELLQGHGWKLVNPKRVARSPSSYRSYIKRSRAEIGCAKPVYRDLKTGWFSDRSACYLASGRPVLAEDTGFSEYLPTGEGLLVFRNLEEAVAGVTAIDANYQRHTRAARELAEEFLDSRRCLQAMLDVCG